MILVIDNYDSFVFNIIQYIKEVSDKKVIVKRNDEINIEQIKDLNPSYIVLSPGPKHPKDSGVCLDILKSDIKIPILGICLGCQAMAYVDGGEIKKLNYPQHGKISKVNILDKNKMFKSLPDQFEVMRYHSLYVKKVPKTYEISALTDDDIVMAIRHNSMPRFGIQFHPESYFTEYGLAMIENFLK